MLNLESDWDGPAFGKRYRVFLSPIPQCNEAESRKPGDCHDVGNRNVDTDSWGNPLINNHNSW